MLSLISQTIELNEGESVGMKINDFSPNYIDFDVIIAENSNIIYDESTDKILQKMLDIQALE